MKMLSAFFLIAVFSGTMYATAFANDAARSPPAYNTNYPVTNSEKQEYKNILQEASAVMGHVAVANIALLYNLPDEAASNVQKAIIIVNKLEWQAVLLNPDFVKFGKLRYTSAAGEAHEYWLPMINGSFVVSNMDSEYLKPNQPSVVEEDARLINTQAVLDVKKMRASLETALAALTIKNYTDAQASLLGAEQSTFTGEIISDIPLVMARDNLLLAEDLSKNKDYNGASFALDHAKDAITEYEKASHKDETVEFKKMKAEISTLHAKLTKDKASMVATIEKRN